MEALENRIVPSTTAPLPLGPAAYDPSRILVCFREDGAGLDVQGATSLGKGLYAVQLAEGMDVETALVAYRANPNVCYAEPDYQVQVQVVPNDARFSELWGLDNNNDADIDAPEAWDISTGSLSVTVGIIDTGIDYRHPDLYLNIWLNPGEVPTSKSFASGLTDTNENNIVDFYDLNSLDAQGNTVFAPGTSTRVNAAFSTDKNGNGVIDAGDLLNDSSWENGSDGNDANNLVDDLVGWDFINNDNDPFDDNEHGTHVAGTIGAIGNNGVGVAGINWQVRMAGLKFLSAQGSGNLGDAVEAINYAVDAGFNLTNNSWGGGGFSQAMFDAISNANDINQLFIAAAGNSSSNNDQFASFPSGYDLPNVIAVAATDDNDDLATFSSFGATTVDLGAPGVGILSTTPDNTYSSFNGTSMATPHVSGVAALVFAQHPDWTAQQVKDQILNTTDPLSSLDGITVTGGRLNAAAALGSSAEDTRGPRVTASTPSSSANPVSSLTVTFNEAVDPATFTVDDLVSFSGPNGDIAIDPATFSVQVVDGSSDKKFTITFPEQAAEGTYTLVFGPDIFDKATVPNAMNQNNDAENGEDPDDRYSAKFTIADQLVFESTDVPAPIFDWTVTISYLTIDQDVTIGSLQVEVNITHTWDDDLQFYLIGPDGSSMVMLSSFHGGAGDNYTDTLFDDNAAQSIAQGSAPFTGSFRPEEPLELFAGLNARGTWQLVVEDWAFGDQGSLTAWSLIVTPEGDPGSPPPPSNQAPNAVNDPSPGAPPLETPEQTPIVIDVLANDSDPDNDPLTIVSVVNLQGGTAVINDGASVTFTPADNFFGSAGFSYTISDGRGGTDTAFVSLFVTPVNDPPVAVDDTASTSRDTPLVFNGQNGNPMPPHLNDTDPDGDPLRITAVSNAVNGTVALDTFSGIVTFTPNAGYTGPASFQYTVADGKGGSDTGLVNISVKDSFYLSTTTDGILVNSDGSTLAVGDEDIVRLSVEGGAYSYQLFFDGSDVGLNNNNEDIDAFTFLPDGSLLISTTGSFSVPLFGGGTLNGGGEDVLRFTPSSFGAVTAGSWSFFFDGSDVGLTGSTENVDAIAMFGNQFLFSTTGGYSVPSGGGTLIGGDTDLLAFTPSSMGVNTFGSWGLFFDGSDVGLSDNTDEDVNAVFVKAPAGPGAAPTLYLSTLGNFSVSLPVPPGGSLNGANEDVFAFTPNSLGQNTAGSYAAALSLDGSQFGLAAFDIDGIHIGLAPGQVPGGLSIASAEDFTAIGAPDFAAPPRSSTPLSFSFETVSLALAQGQSSFSFAPRVQEGAPPAPALSTAATDQFFALRGSSEQELSLTVTVLAARAAESCADVFALSAPWDWLAPADVWRRIF